jgi:lipoprotein-releasing system ATP-binding protein
VNQPKLLLADEPTGNLDHTNAMSVFEMLSALQQEHDLALVLVTHDDSLAKHMGSVKMLQDGGWA